MRGRVPRRVKRTTNFIPAGDTFFSSLFCYAHFQSRKFGGTFFVSAIDFCLQDSFFEVTVKYSIFPQEKGMP